ncbi:UDP-N-acetylglucosamine 2-epimerase (non-hydrolyzing) [Victivallis vadensis]|uniref:UDP-N-acetylglucosamine 2-epimerase (non-hydrolyzing) n=1 Tax=Victivallis vadensis TaxID=172901 RepID=A0A848B6E9_9BACT|nr:UDP-N-acetylglucosamine 2-epimerase (non-hydrolyzing) [Victivallis vadensis]NMD89259.1 UDP-N-acetylglucosamine 2-epimerase (non-hydrolyzing) [Victivallis vadensis]
MELKKILIIFGTRPEAIKMAPVVAEFQRRPECEVKVCFSGQHREMVEQVLEVFGLVPDFDLAVMKKGQTLTEVTTGILDGMERLLEQYAPDMVLVQGDTTTVLAASLAAFYRRIPIGHVEAGLRTGNRYSPFPEEMNRLLASRLATLHFAPTECARKNLQEEKIPESDISVTGNTVIDALHIALNRLDADSERLWQMEAKFSYLNPARKLILVTGHRRENHGDGIRQICTALKRLAGRNDVEILYPVHPNPNIRMVVEKELDDTEGILLCRPQDYLSFLYLMRRSFLILTDSGGIQEEAPALGKPALVMRESTERPEALEAGTIRLVGHDPERIVGEAEKLLDFPEEYRRRCRLANPFGDGSAARRIADIVLEHLSE